MVETVSTTKALKLLVLFCFVWGLWEISRSFSATLILKDYGSLLQSPNAKKTVVPHDILRQEITTGAARNEPSLPSENEESFSACLITMDDNHFLIEWLAYHFHVLPLRRLIVAVDPRSKYSPSSIFERYRKYGLMEITEWSDPDFIDVVQNSDTGDLTKQFLRRQVVFYSKCMQQLLKEGNSWTLLIDTDEYLVANRLSAPTFRVADNARSTIYKMVAGVQAANLSKMTSSPCIVLPRLRFGTRESNISEVRSMVPDYFNASDFSTLRWRFRAMTGFGNRFNKHNGHPKGMVDLRRVQNWMIDFNSTTSVHSLIDVHRPVKAVCDENNHYTHPRNASFVIHHYPGTLEQWIFRNDARDWTRNKEAYKELAKRGKKVDDSIRPWLEDFVSRRGRIRASFLLNGVGKLPVPGL